jgi:hypothetical protein
MNAVYSSDPGGLAASVRVHHKKAIKSSSKIGLVGISIVNNYQQDLPEGTKASPPRRRRRLRHRMLVTSIPTTARRRRPDAQVAGD